MKKESIRLNYLSVYEMRNSEREPKAQPCVVQPDEGKPFRVVPITPMMKSHSCLGCVGHHGSETGNSLDCGHLPDCGNAVYVRATPANKLKHIAWLLDQHN
jgi:hypothetical protein